MPGPSAHPADAAPEALPAMACLPCPLVPRKIRFEKADSRRYGALSRKERIAMKLGLGLYRHMLTPDNFRFARQAGATHIVAHLTDYFRTDDSLGTASGDES